MSGLKYVNVEPMVWWVNLLVWWTDPLWKYQGPKFGIICKILALWPIVNIQLKKAKTSDGCDFPIWVIFRTPYPDSRMVANHIIRTEEHHLYKLNEKGYNTHPQVYKDDIIWCTGHMRTCYIQYLCPDWQLQFASLQVEICSAWIPCLLRTEKSSKKGTL